MQKASNRSVSEWLTYLENRHHKPIQLGLQRVLTVARQLGLLAFNAPVITIAGTNGKGSTLTALEAIYTHQGYKVAAYTSPHLLCFNERIRLQQKHISDDALKCAFLAIDKIKTSEALTYFEMVTLAALWHFKQNNPDVILLEVGMGGRLDATNCIDADLAIVTTIDLDHQAFLGNTRDLIAKEKAGIFRPNQPAIYADINPPKSLLLHAEALAVELSIFSEHYTYEYTCEHTKKSFHFLNSKNTPTLTLEPPQLEPRAFAAAIMATLKLQHRLPVISENYAHTAKTAFIPGRQQWLNTTIPTLVDVAHNKQSVDLLSNRIKSNPTKGKIHAVFSGLQDKTLYDLISPMRAYVDTWYLTTVDNARSATQDALKKACICATNNAPFALFDAPEKAYAAACSAVEPGDIILVYGSFLLVSAIMLMH